MAAKTRPAKRSAEQLELDRARKRIERLEDDLAKRKLALEIQGKASELLERLLAGSDPREQAAAVIDECFGAIEPMLGTKTACTAVGRPRATHYRHQRAAATAFVDTAAGAAEQAHRRRG